MYDKNRWHITSPSCTEFYEAQAKTTEPSFSNVQHHIKHSFRVTLPICGFQDCTVFVKLCVKATPEQQTMVVYTQSTLTNKLRR